MSLEDQRGGFVGEDEAMNRFPLGMRVLAVDDDPTCLKVIENLLRKCQYQVTTTNQAIKALKMLRENRNKYDLVISDVNMPDMDGFNLLELVGLEMDLPVIMLSGHSDTKLVMKGITHGACDYLLKPVRIEELKNIWQHVVRRRTFESNDEKKPSNQEQECHGTGDSGKWAVSSSNLDQNGKVNRKRKDKNEDDEEQSDDSGHDNEDPSSQKKPRVVWSVELHRKFVAVVNQLGLEKAVPKKILDMMNVEGLTRENVASHLQKYRLYLKRISNVASQQASLVAAFGGKDASYINIGSADGFGDLRTITASGRLGNTALTSYAHKGLIGRLNSSAGLTLRGITSSGFIQPDHQQNLSSNSFDSLVKFHCLEPVSQRESLFQGIATSVEENQLQQTKCTNPLGEFSPFIDPTGFTGSASFPDARVTIGSSSNSVSSASSNPFMLQRNPHQTHNTGVLGSRSSLGGTSSFLDQNACETWQSAVHQEQLHSSNIDISSASLQNVLNLSATHAIPSSLEDSRDVQCQEGLFWNISQTINYAQNHSWEEHKLDYNHNLNQSVSATNSFVPADSILGPFNQSLDQCSAVFHKEISSFYNQISGASASIFQPIEVGKLAIDTMMKPNEDYIADHMVSQGGFPQNSCGSFDDIITSLMRREQNEIILTDGEFGFDGYSLGPSSCI